LKKLAILFAVLFAIPTFAEVSHDITLPVVGRVILPHVTYTTELTITNHRDVEQLVAIDFIGITTSRPIDGVVRLGPRETWFDPAGLLGAIGSRGQGMHALRIWAVTQSGSGGTYDGSMYPADPNGRIDATAYIVAVRGPFGLYGTSRQEVRATPSEDYRAKEAIFHGVRHDLPVYTNVGITNMHETQTETFYVQFAYLDPVEVVVPPLTHVQVRIPGMGNAGRTVRVYPAWAANGENRTTPWVAYASSVDGQTGDAWSGIRAPSKNEFKP
jgi:hypothetical protein